MTEPQLTRRQLFALLGMGGVVVAGTCSGLTILAILAARERNPPAPRVVQITATPPPTPDLTFPNLIRREAWGAPPPNHFARNEGGFYDADFNPTGWYTYAEPLATRYQTVVVHHSVINEGNNAESLRQIMTTHRDQRGWADVGYHYLVGQDGGVYEGRVLGARGAHVAGFNTGSVGVCLIGDYTADVPPVAQINAARELILWLAGALRLTHIAAHNDFNPDTQCPGDYLAPYVGAWAQAAGLSVGRGGYVPPT